MSKILPINSLNRVPLREVVPLDTPFSVYIFPTTFCNFKCVYCVHSLDHKSMQKKYNFEPQTMSMDTYLKIIEQLKDFPRRLKLLSLTGHGEPMINKNLPEMVQLAKQSDVTERIEIISNASLLTHDIADSLIAAGLDGLRVSLQGMNAKKYKDICGWTLDFEELLKSLRYFYDRRNNCELFVKVIDVALDKGEEAEFYRIFDAMSDRMHVERCRDVYNGVEFTENMREDTLGRWGNVHEPFEICPLSFFQLGIFPDGDVEPCDTIYKPIVLGNVHSETLKSMYTSEKLRQFQVEQLKNKRYQNPKCAICTAPDDVSLPIDRLDDAIDDILSRMN